MGKYIDSALLPGETVVAEARPHWAMFVAPGLVSFFGLLMWANGSSIVLILGLLWLGFRFLVYNTTELAVTNKRVVAKSGIIRRNEIDVSLSKVEGTTYHQGIIGRIFGYGSILVRGTGVGQLPIPFIAQPDQFKHEVGRLVHA